MRTIRFMPGGIPRLAMATGDMGTAMAGIIPTPTIQATTPDIITATVMVVDTTAIMEATGTAVRT
ncbi:MAG: hypothetical protein RhofKO_33120 [Rhodothermales bacterium]